MGIVENAFIGMGAIEEIGRGRLTIFGFLAGFAVGGTYGYIMTRDAGLALSAGGLLGGAAGAGIYLYATGGKLVTERLKK